jgi:hypothetical protein
MIIVGNYSPTGLDYDKLTNLETLQMFDGAITAAQQTSIQTLAGSKLTYLEVSNWSTSFARNSSSKLKELRLGGMTNVGESVFKDNPNIETVHLPQAVTIGAWAFYACSVKSLYCPNVTTIGTQAFENCSSLKSLYLPVLTTVGGRAFRGCGAEIYAPNWNP